MIRVEGLSKTYSGASHPSLDNITLEIQKGDFVTLIGTSGCGKTTFLKTINQLLVQDEGSIWINDKDISSLDPHILRREIGYVIQKIGLFDHLNIADNIALVPKMLKWPKEKIDARIDELLTLVNLDPAVYKKRFPRELSGGQQQRVGIARALAVDPDILLMDEPFGAIDAINRLELQNQLLSIQRKTGKTILFVTHDLSEAFKLGSKILIMDQGEIQQFGTPKAILQKPENNFVRNFLTHNGSVQVLNLVQAKHLMQDITEDSKSATTFLHEETSASDVLFHMIKRGEQCVYLKDADNKPVGQLSLEAFETLDW